MKVNLIFKSEQAALDKLRENHNFCAINKLFPKAKVDQVERLQKVMSKINFDTWHSDFVARLLFK